MAKVKYNKLPKFIPCKPCWELKYCPYGPLVEFFPLFGPPDDAVFQTFWPDNDVMSYVAKDDHEFLKGCDPLVLSCNVFGHVCPVFMMAEPFTETKASRMSGRYIPRDIMLKVVRRDNYTCQVCAGRVLDNEIEIDHIIPHAKGGPTTPENLRLLCRGCNRKKSDSLAEILEGQSTRKKRRKNVSTKAKPNAEE
jgi:5-methylcytosine-specific restriction endonuclease McrA